jgi:hypothetical protein
MREDSHFLNENTQLIEHFRRLRVIAADACVNGDDASKRRDKRQWFAEPVFEHFSDKC